MRRSVNSPARRRATQQRHSNHSLTPSAVLRSARLRRLRRHPRVAVQTAFRRLQGGGGGLFLPAAAWACENDLQGAARKHEARDAAEIRPRWPRGSREV